MTTPTLSVIVPTYNYGRFLPIALASIAAQSFTDYELIVVDDGSTDGTAGILARYDDPRLVTVRQLNSGIMAARATGVRLSRGRLVAWLDADDVWFPTYLERQVAIFQSEPALGLCFTDFVRRDIDGRILPQTQFDHAPGLRSLRYRDTGVDLRARVLAQDTFEALAPFRDMPGWLQATMMNGDMIRGIRFNTDIRQGEDLYLMLQMYTRGGAAFIDEPLVEVRRHGGNSYLTHDQIRLGILDVVQRCLDDLVLTPTQREVLQRRIGAEYSSRGWRHFWAHEPAEAARYYSQALAWPGGRLNALGHLALLPVLPLLPRRDPPF